MNIKINGKEETVDKATNIAELILEKGISSERIVVEHNFKITSKEGWPHLALSEGDNIEIVSFMGGG